MSVIETPATSVAEVCARRTSAARRPVRELVNVETVSAGAWRELAERAAEPNAFYDPDWARAVARHARGHSGAKALLVWDNARRDRLIGLLPVVSAWRALKLPVPVFVAWQAYAPLTVPLLDRNETDNAARGLISAAAEAGASALLLPYLPANSAVATAFRRVLSEHGVAPYEFDRHARAKLDARQDPQSVLRDALSTKKLKELRRQRNRLGDDDKVTFDIACEGETVAAAVDEFLALEASGWKGQRGTALDRHEGDRLFIREASRALAARGRFEVAMLRRGGTPVAAGIVLRQGRRAYFFKMAYDEALAKMSPGVQLTLDLTRYFCADAHIDDVDSTACAGHPMIDHIWRGRLDVEALYVPVRLGGPHLNLIRYLIKARNAMHKSAARVVRYLRAIRENRR